MCCPQKQYILSVILFGHKPNESIQEIRISINCGQWRFPWWSGCHWGSGRGWGCGDGDRSQCFFFAEPLDQLFLEIFQRFTFVGFMMVSRTRSQATTGRGATTRGTVSRTCGSTVVWLGIGVCGGTAPFDEAVRYITYSGGCSVVFECGWFEG